MKDSGINIQKSCGRMVEVYDGRRWPVVKAGNVFINHLDTVQKVTQTVLQIPAIGRKKRNRNKYTVAVGTSHGHVQTFLKDKDLVLAVYERCQAEEKCLLLIEKPKDASKKLLMSRSVNNLTMSDTQLYRHKGQLDLLPMHLIHTNKEASHPDSQTADIYATEPRHRKSGKKGEVYRSTKFVPIPELGIFSPEQHVLQNGTYAQYCHARDTRKHDSSQQSLKEPALTYSNSSFNSSIDDSCSNCGTQGKGQLQGYDRYGEVFHSCIDISVLGQGDLQPNPQHHPQPNPQHHPPDKKQLYGDLLPQTSRLEPNHRSHSLGDLATGLTFSLVGQKKVASEINVQDNLKIDDNNLNSKFQQLENGNCYSRRVYNRPDLSVRHETRVFNQKNIENGLDKNEIVVKNVNEGQGDWKSNQQQRVSVYQRFNSSPEGGTGRKNSAQACLLSEAVSKQLSTLAINSPSALPDRMLPSHRNPLLKQPLTLREESPVKPKRSLPTVPVSETSEKIKRMTEMMKSRMSRMSDGGSAKSTPTRTNSQESASSHDSVFRKNSDESGSDITNNQRLRRHSSTTSPQTKVSHPTAAFNNQEKLTNGQRFFSDGHYFKYPACWDEQDAKPQVMECVNNSQNGQSENGHYRNVQKKIHVQNGQSQTGYFVNGRSQKRQLQNGCSSDSVLSDLKSVREPSFVRETKADNGRVRGYKSCLNPADDFYYKLDNSKPPYEEATLSPGDRSSDSAQTSATNYSYNGSALDSGYTTNNENDSINGSCINTQHPTTDVYLDDHSQHYPQQHQQRKFSDSDFVECKIQNSSKNLATSNLTHMRLYGSVQNVSSYHSEMITSDPGLFSSNHTLDYEKYPRVNNKLSLPDQRFPPSKFMAMPPVSARPLPSCQLYNDASQSRLVEANMAPRCGEQGKVSSNQNVNFSNQFHIAYDSINRNKQARDGCEKNLMKETEATKSNMSAVTKSTMSATTDLCQPEVARSNLAGEVESSSNTFLPNNQRKFFQGIELKPFSFKKKIKPHPLTVSRSGRSVRGHTLPGGFRFVEPVALPSLTIFDMCHKYDLFPVRINLPQYTTLTNLIQLTEESIQLDSTSPVSPKGQMAKIGGPGSAFTPVKHLPELSGLVSASVVSVVAVDESAHSGTELGRLIKGDIIVEVNGWLCLNAGVEEIERNMSGSRGVLTLTVARCRELQEVRFQGQTALERVKSLEAEISRLDDIIQQRNEKIRQLTSDPAWFTHKTNQPGTNEKIRQLTSDPAWFTHKTNQPGTLCQVNGQLPVEGMVIGEDEYVV